MSELVAVGSRRRNQPAPPHVLFDVLTRLDDDRGRSWLVLLDDEVRPRVVETDPPHLVVWSSPWTERPDAVVRLDLPADGGGGTDLRWTLLVAEPLPPDAWVGHARFRLNRLINADLRYTFGQ